MRIKNYEDLKFECNLAFLEDSVSENKIITEAEFINIQIPKLNQTSLYLFPSLKLEKIVNNFEILRKFGFINLYSYYNKCDIEFCLHILFNPAISKLQEFEGLLDSFKGLHTYISTEKLDSNVYVISLLMYSEFSKIFYPFINGEYSKIDSKYAEIFPYNVKNGEKEYSKQYHTIKHTEYFQNKKEQEFGLRENTLKDTELDEMIHLEREILNYNYIKNARNRSI